MFYFLIFFNTFLLFNSKVLSQTTKIFYGPQKIAQGLKRPSSQEELFSVLTKYF